MSNFVAQVRVKLLDDELKTLQNLKDQTVNVKVNLTGNGANFIKSINGQLNSISNTAAQSGIKAGKNFSKSFGQQLSNIKSTEQKLSNRLSNLQNLKSSSKSLYGDTTAYAQLTANIQKAEQAHIRLNAEMAKGSSANLDSINADLTEMNKLLSKSENLYSNLTKPLSTFDAVTASNKTQTWLQNNTKAAKEMGAAFELISQKQLNAKSKGELEAYNKEFRNLVTMAQSRGLTGNSFLNDLGRGFKQIGQFVGTYGVYMKAVESLKKMATAVRDVDDAMTELRKVTDAPMSQVSAYFDEATESAKKYGQTISDVIKTTADWQRLGYNLKDAKQLSDMTTLYQNVGDNMTQESASSSMVSTLQGFQLAADQAEHIVDAFNEVDVLAS